MHNSEKRPVIGQANFPFTGLCVHFSVRKMYWLGQLAVKGLSRGNSAALGKGFLSHPTPWDFSPQVPLLRQICVSESKLVGFNHGIAYMCIFTKYFFLYLSRRNLNWSLVLYTKARLQRSGESFLKCILFITH